MTQKTGQQVLQTQLLPLSKIQTNKGQIRGLPKNPRLIRDSRFIALKKSITDFPEMLGLREIVVAPLKGKFVCVGGNMRYAACKELEFAEIPAKVLPANFPIEKLREFAVKDNINFGQDDLDLLAAEWSEFPLIEWGAELPDLSNVDLDDFFKEDESEPKAVSHNVVLSYTTEAECDGVKTALLKISDTFEAAVAKLLTG